LSVCVRLTRVDKRFANVKALSDVSVAFPEGETTAVVGESGSGKTTMLQLINAVHRADSGDVEVFGEPIPGTGIEAFRRRIGYAVQGAGLFPHLTSRRNVDLVARLEGWTAQRIEQRYQLLLEQMGLSDDVSERYPHELSGGQQQRLGLCRAMMLEPRLMLLDEPFSAIDPITRAGIYREFLEVQNQAHMSVVLITHDMREAVRLAQYLVIVREGMVLQQGRTEDVLAAPAFDYVRELLKDQL
jgi:osmoprotectant transport system ATP-binding protein